MLSRLIGHGSTVAHLKAGLDASTRAVREIAHRVANAGTPAGPSFASALDAARQGAIQGEAVSEVDLEAEMVRLADEQLRFEMGARLLEKTYEQIRSSIRER